MRVSQKVMIAEEGTIKANLAIYVDYVRESSNKVCMCPKQMKILNLVILTLTLFFIISDK